MTSIVDGHDVQPGDRGTASWGLGNVPDRDAEGRPRKGWAKVWYTLWPVVRGFLWGMIGFVVGAAATSYAMGYQGLNNAAMVVGYCLALAGWILGIGAWEAIVRPYFGGSAEWDEGGEHGIARYFRLNTNHKVIGMQFLIVAGLNFVLAGLAAMNMRVELMSPGPNWFASQQQYLEVMGIHGTIMIFGVATVLIFSGLGHYFVPLMIGANRMIFPRLEAVTAWLYPAAAMAIMSSLLVGGWTSGWFSYVPLQQVDESGQMFYNVGVFTMATAASLSAINFIGTIIFLRARGLTWSRLPIFVWSILLTSFLAWYWVAIVDLAMVSGLTDSVAGTNFYRGVPMTPHKFGALGAGAAVSQYVGAGKALVWQDLFWLFSHPEVYIIMMPAWGIWLEVAPVFARKTLFAYRWMIAGLLGVTFLSSYVWTHHMFAVVRQSRLIPFMVTTELISIPTSLVFLCLIGTIWKGRIFLRVPMLLVMFSAVNFFIGGITGTMLADVSANFWLTDTYFVVGHFHYTILGGMIFAWLGGMYYWLPKFTGRMFPDRWAKAAAWFTFIAFNWTFSNFIFLGFRGMNRRINTYPSYLGTENFWTSIGAWLLGASFCLHLGVFVYTWFWGRKTVANPWRARTLEWQVSSPPPHTNWDEEAPPIVVEDFYAYGEGAGTESGLFPVPGVEHQAAPLREHPLSSGTGGEE